MLIGLIGLGGLYTISSQSSKEGFSTMEEKPLEEPIQMNSINDYKQPNAITDKYYDGSKVLADMQDFAKKNVSFKSLNGETVDATGLTHNNMVPYFGAKIRGRGANMDQAEGLLDNKVGSGSQSFSKEERAPLFEPQEHMHWAHGTPNMTTFVQSRQNPSMAMNNVKPWQEEHVAPGLGKGPESGSLGFNSGLMDREEWLPKTVDNLRVDTNPKNTFELTGHEGPAMSTILKPGIEGEVMKNRPETSYSQSPDRYLVTMGEGGSRPRTNYPLNY